MRSARSDNPLTILDLILMVAGAAFGLWLIAGTPGGQPGPDPEGMRYVVFLVYLLGGLSIIGPPLLLIRRRRLRRRLGPGEFLWFCQGTASWLLWPPIVFQRWQAKPNSDSMATVCYFYGTPMMALFVTISLLSGGWLRRGRRRRRSGRETFGLLLGLAWACTGLYVLSLIYRNDFK